MAKIFAPNKEYNGISAGIPFLRGVGETSDSYLIDWFKSKGYDVEEDIVEDAPDAEVDTAVDLDDEVINDVVNDDDVDVDPDPDPVNLETVELDAMTVKELIKFAEVNTIYIGNATSKKGILKKIVEAAKKTEE